jgi:hypothetical protein
MIAMLDQYIMLVTNVKVKEKLKDKDLLSEVLIFQIYNFMLGYNQ